jgi:hypothetical protein
MSQRESTVWMVHRGTGLAGVKGLLTLEGQSLVFKPESSDQDQTAFALDGISRTRRVLGSPILEIYTRLPGAPPVVGFYFTKPPSLDPERAGGLVFKQRTARRAAVSRLREWNAVKRDEVTAWVKAIARART